MKIYVASSWRNILQPAIVSMLRSCGHEVYDFRNPVPGNSGFSWRSIDPNWQNWTPRQYRVSLDHPIAAAGFNLDMNALRACDACVLVLPSGRSASFEFGWAIGAGKRGAVVMFDACEPELMYRGNPILTTPDELLDWGGFSPDSEARPKLYMSGDLTTLQASKPKVVHADDCPYKPFDGAPYLDDGFQPPACTCMPEGQRPKTESSQ